uniref:sensor domain-containing protein n=1 Tax=Streptomyces acidiscabies TaxID=42234 RepID=UPI0015C0A103
MGRDERARDVWEGLAGRGYLLSPWPWRAVLYLLTGAVTGAFVLVGLVLLAVAGLVLAVVLVGLPLLGFLAFAGLPVAALERRRLRLVDREEAPGAHAEPAVPGLRGWLAVRARERATWRELGHTLLTACLWWPAEAVLLALALGGPLTMIAAPVLFGTVGGGRETKVLKVWTVTGWPAAFAACLGGVVLLAAGLYVIGVAAGARGALTR